MPASPDLPSPLSSVSTTLDVWKLRPSLAGILRQSPAIEGVDGAAERATILGREHRSSANSTQSLRIRNLEAEVSRLLAENVSLREQIIGLQSKADRDRGRRVLENVEGIKRMLEGKIQEFGDLVGGLVAASLDASPRTSRARRSPGQDQKNWKNTFTLSEVTSNHEGRLPPILEDKMYPRRSIDSNEPYLPRSDPHNIPDSSLSPELGPPPIAHFEEEPVKFDPSGRANVGGVLGLEIDDGITFLPANLEKRKKRRDSANLSEILGSAESSQHGQRQLSMAENQLVNGDASQPLRTGAKRKLSVRDEDEKPEKNLPTDFDDFRFSRKVTTGRGKDEHRLKTNSHSAGSKGGNESTLESGAVGRVHDEKQRKRNPTVSDRKALGPKSTNTDPASSPLKITKSTLLEDITKIDAAKKAAAMEHGRGRDRRSVTVVRPRNEEANVELIKLEPEPAQIEPETPCPPDLLSPISSQPSTTRPISRDTPPPPDLNHSSVTADGFTLAARATRRPRVSVNYAEPNLRDKMRRPTKELVDAVTGEGKGHRMSGVKKEGNRSADEGSSNDKNQIRTVVIKRERDDGSDQSWKSLQPSSLDSKGPSTLLGLAYKTVKAREGQDGSPLNSKGGANTQSELPNSIITQRRRRTSTTHQGNGGFTGEQSASAAALLEMRKRSGEIGDRRKDTAIQNAMEKLQALDIYDFRGSSSPTAGDSATESSTSRTSHHRSPEDDGVSGTDAISGSRSSRRGGGRRQTLVENTQVAGDTNGGARTTRSVASLGGLKGNVEGCVEGGGAGTGGRAAGRRRSMVL
ncbi:MAG: hypothetical protein M1840_002231 [Geoglossum simile]|nr:MAG: hypothetical protein M1840_002231 [Geoglossum simile]